MKRVWLVGALLCATVSSTAFAQYTAQSTPYGSAPASKADIVLLGGYAFTMSKDIYPVGLPAGQLDINDNAYYGIALDINVARRPDKTGQLRLMYRREDSEMVFRPSIPGGATVNPIDCAIEYWQIGGVGGIRRGKAMPFTAVTLGGTRFAASGADEWKFSMIFGLGVKVYSSPKMGLMLQANWPITFTDTWGGVTVGTGGAGVAMGGTGVSQLDIGGGLFLSF
jgi:hypothetical protein